MFDLNMLTPDARLYFDAMPPILKSSLVQSGVKLTTKKELEDFLKMQEKK